jgi:hypothetical protein
MEDESASDKIILEEFDKFVETVGKRLTAFNTWGPEDAMEFEKDGKAMVKRKLTEILGPLAGLIRMKRGPSHFNGFQRDNFSTKAAEMKETMQSMEESESDNPTSGIGKTALKCV